MRLTTYNLRLTTFLVIIGIGTHSFAQSAPDTAIRIYESNDVKNIVEKKMEYARIAHGTIKGYRIQINFGQDRNMANSVRNDFSAKYPGIASYMSYQQPYFKVNVGDFRSKLEAVKNLNMIRKTYPGAFIVMDKINVSTLPQ
jgi:hypothetical protein